MEELNVYSIRVGTRSRSGSLINAIQFCTKSKKSYNDVYSYFMKRYHGYSVEVEIIKDFIEEDIPSINDSQKPTSYVESNLVREIERLKRRKFRVFSGNLYFSAVPDVVNSIKELKDLKSQYENKRCLINNTLKSYIKEKYSPICKSVDIQDWKIDSSYFPFTVELFGEILPEENEIK